MIAKRSRTKAAGASAPPPAGDLALGELAPGRIVEPADAAEVAAVLGLARQAAEAVVAHGGGTLQRASNLPTRYDVALLLRRLDAVHDYDPRDLTIGAGAGMTLETLQRTLAQHGQFLPLDAPLPSRATIGGTLAAGWAGPRRTAYGRPRDLLIGSTIALADGTLATAGGMVVKNVTGYDMSRLYVGSHGTLGVLTRANFKVLPAPAVRRIALAPFEDEQRARLIAHALRGEIEPAALLVLDAHFVPAALRDRGSRNLLLALFEGSEALVERAIRGFRSELGAAGVAETRIRDGAEAGTAFQLVIDEYVSERGESSTTLLARGLPSDAAERADHAFVALAPLGADREVGGHAVATLADLLTGDVVVRVAESDAISLTAAVATVRDVLGHAQRIAGRGPGIDAWGGAPTALATMRALKERFDPERTLAPGRYLGGI